MNKLIVALIAVILTGCVSLPGSEGATSTHYALQGYGGECETGDRALGLSIVSVAPGLDTTRVARRNSETGEVTYLKGLRWVENIDSMLEQRLAADLECRGFVVQTGHRTRAAHGRLLCEVRALNLVQASTGDRAEFSLSCMFHEAGSEQSKVILESGSVPLDRWSSSQAMAALGGAYREVLENLVEQLR